MLEAISKGAAPVAIAVIIRQIGASYRPLGAVMAVFADGSHSGHLSSGCIEADILDHAKTLQQPRILRYGAGSPFIDLTLPCGGTLDVLIAPCHDAKALQTAAQAHAARVPVAVSIDLETGALAGSDATETGLQDGRFHWFVEPKLKFMVYGNGYEAAQFASLVDGAGYLGQLYATNAAVFDLVNLPPVQCNLMPRAHISDPDQIDRWTAVTLFFHEHDLEDQILQDALQTPAFYIGAQGSMTAQAARLDRLQARGLTADQLTRCRGPIGLIAKTRDPRTLAVSVLAEILTVAQGAAV
jgi:xanthine dehydrogenase accessory factor